jgi:hypothetical protein
LSKDLVSLMLQNPEAATALRQLVSAEDLKRSLNNLLQNGDCSHEQYAKLWSALGLPKPRRKKG